MRNTLLLFSAPTSSPYHSSKEYERFRNLVRKVAPDYFISAETLFISPIFGLVPFELTNYYPLAQNLVPQIEIFQIESVIIEQLGSYLSTNPQFTNIFGIFGKSDNWKSFTRRCRKLLKQLKKNFTLSTSDFSKESLNTIIPKLISKIKAR
jgi:predicted RNA-binding protein